jgi:hypothetical protein
VSGTSIIFLTGWTGFSGLFSDLKQMKIILIIVCLLGLYKIAHYLILLFEKEHVRGDFIPHRFVPEEWKSQYLAEKMAEAEGLGMIFCDSYKHIGLVKGPLLLYRTSNGDALVVLISARFMGAEIKKVLIQTIFNDGTALATSDGVQMPDLTEGIEKRTFYEAPLSELLDNHRKRVAEIGKSFQRITAESAFSLFERIEVERAERMVRVGYARWTDPTHTTFRRTLKGVMATSRANQAESKRLINEVCEKKQATGGEQTNGVTS